MHIKNGTAQEISSYAMEHMCEPNVNVSSCRDCVTVEELGNISNNSNHLEKPQSSPTPEDAEQSIQMNSKFESKTK